MYKNYENMNGYKTYNGYELNDGYESYRLDKKDKECLNLGIAIIEEHYSIRQCAKEGIIGYSKSHIHRIIHSEIKDMSSEMYRLVKKQLKINSKHKMGGFRT